VVELQWVAAERLLRVDEAALIVALSPSTSGQGYEIFFGKLEHRSDEWTRDS
jgi:hypothetical protein